MIKANVMLLLILLLGLSFSANATIMSTEVAGSMKIEYTNTPSSYMIDISGNVNGTTQANVNLTGLTTGINVYSDLDLNYLTAEEAALGFAIGWDAIGYSSSGYMGHTGPNTNYAEIEYSAIVDSVMTYDWDFAYSGVNPFGLSVVQILANGSSLQILGDIGNVGIHQGSDFFHLMAGNDYTFKILFNPNIGGGIGGLQGDLIGFISFDFNGGATPAPEPATMLLHGIGLACLVGFGRKKFQKESKKC
jgi:hypothetical protein